MTTVIHVTSERYEADGFYSEDSELIAHWDHNDANWRSEYMNGLLKGLGHTVKEADDDSPLVEVFDCYLEETCGYERED